MSTEELTNTKSQKIDLEALKQYKLLKLFNVANIDYAESIVDCICHDQEYLDSHGAIKKVKKGTIVEFGRHFGNDNKQKGDPLTWTA